jgi:hypothetical protein
MDVALGLKAHYGWSVLVVVGMADGEPLVIDRRRIELVEPEDIAWAKQPYHAADGQGPADARDTIKRGVEAAREIAVWEIRAAIRRSHEWQHDIAACAVLVPESMPGWSVEEILSVHIRMHQAEGALFPDALTRAADTCDLPCVAIPEKHLGEYAENAFHMPMKGMTTKIAALGKLVGPPWGMDQKNATLAALAALQAMESRRA